MTSIATTAATGLHAAQLRLSASAHNVALSNTPGARGQRVHQQAAAGLGGVQAQVQPAAAPGVQPETEAVEQLAAVYAFKASALVLRRADEALGTLLDTRT